MIKFASHSFAALAALVLSVASISLIVSVPAPVAAPAASPPLA